MRYVFTLNVALAGYIVGAYCCHLLILIEIKPLRFGTIFDVLVGAIALATAAAYARAGADSIAGLLGGFVRSRDRSGGRSSRGL